ncbi:MAG: hypothetical protein ACO201_03945 [Rickettsiales bacterium]
MGRGRELAEMWMAKREVYVRGFVNGLKIKASGNGGGSNWGRGR